MRIIHPKGECYDLPNDTSLEFTRYNPFFNEIGELSQPIQLPLTPKNKRLLGFPCRMDRYDRITDIDVIIDFGFTSIPARQIIHSVDSDTVDTTFYLNDGGFYARISDTTLKDVFLNNVIEFNSVISAVEFCESMNLGYTGSNPDSRFAIFEVAIDGVSEGEYITLNESQGGGSKKYKGRNARTETVDGKTITYPQGYGITPFVRVNFVLNSICQYFGYETDLGLFNEIPFSDMVLLNTNMDTIIDGKIHLCTLMPDITVKEFLSAMRSRFCVEFYPNEINKKLHVQFFKDIQDKAPVDLTNKMAGYPTIEYPTFKKISLISEPVIERDDSYQNINELLSSHNGIFRIQTYPYDYSKLPGINTSFFYHPLTQKIYQTAIRGLDVIFVERGTFSDSYISSGTIEEKQITIDGKIPSTITALDPKTELYDSILYIGKGRCVKSVILYSDDTSDTDSSGDALPMMTAFAGYYNKGTVGDLCRHSDTPLEYSLIPNGEKGLFSKFWTYYAYLNQNAFSKITVMMQLSLVDKASLSPMEKVILNDQEYIIDSIRYTMDQDSISEVTLYSLGEYTPVLPVDIKSLDDYPKYEWVIVTVYDIPGYEVKYLTFSNWNSTIETIYFENPTESDYNNYRNGSSNYAQVRTYDGEWYRTTSGPNSEHISGTVMIGFQVKKVS